MGRDTQSREKFAETSGEPLSASNMRNAKREANHVGYDCFDEEGRAHRLVVSSSRRLVVSSSRRLIGCFSG